MINQQQQKVKTIINIYILPYNAKGAETGETAEAEGQNFNEIETKSFQDQKSQLIGRSDQVDGSLQCLLHATPGTCRGASPMY